MLSLVRSGASILKIAADDADSDILNALAAMHGIRSEESLDVLNRSGEGDTVVILTTEDESKRKKVFRTTIPTSEILCEIINKGCASCVKRVELAPPHIIMRLMGKHVDAAIDRVAHDFNARDAKSANIASNVMERGVLVSFTPMPLNTFVHSRALHKRALLIDKPFGQLMAFLRATAQEYLGIATGSPDWNEIEMTIFDASGQYNLHYNRLITALSGLDAGLVTDEKWALERTLALRRSEIYTVRFYTPLPPSDVKKIAMALEYIDDGPRVVDIDVHFEGKKIDWSSERHQGAGDVRADIGREHRSRLLERLPGEARAKLLSLDAQIERV